MRSRLGCRLGDPAHFATLRRVGRRRRRIVRGSVCGSVCGSRYFPGPRRYRGLVGSASTGAPEPRGALSGVEVDEATAIATTFLEPTILWALLLLRRTRRIARVRSVHIRGGRVLALVRADLTRIRRMWTALALWLCLLPVPYLANVAVPGNFVPAVHIVTAFAATNALANGLRITFRSAALRRALGGSDRELLLAHLVVPAAGSIVWCALTAPAIPGLPILAEAISAVGSVAVAYRIATRPPVEYTSPLLDMMGVSGIPIGLIIQLGRGPSLLIVLAWLQIFICRLV